MGNKEIIRNEKFFAFNIWDILSAKAAIDAAAEMRNNICLQTSVKVFNILDKEEFIYIVKRYAKLKNINVIVNLDHCKDVEVIKEAISYKWDCVMIDGSHLSLKDNIKLTNEVCSMIKSKNVLVEAEVGVIKGTEDDIMHDEEIRAKVKDVLYFNENTSVDLLAVAVGTAHGLYTSGYPQIQYDTLHVLSKKLNMLPLVIHGGSGLDDSTLKKLFTYNVAKVNISTDLKEAYKSAVLNISQDNNLIKKFDSLVANDLITNFIKNTVKSKLKILEGI